MPSIPGCATQGETFDELLSNIYEAVEDCMNVDVQNISMAPKLDLIPIQRGENNINCLQVFTGIAGLSVGTLIYLSDRAPETTWLVRILFQGITFHDCFPDLFGMADRNLASFLHVFSFTMISAGVMAESKKGCFMAALLWCSIDALFEIGQYFDDLTVKLLPDVFQHLFFLETLDDYFIAGTFDPYDLAAVFAGALTGYFISVTTLKRGGEEKIIETQQ